MQLTVAEKSFCQTLVAAILVAVFAYHEVANCLPAISDNKPGSLRQVDHTNQPNNNNNNNNNNEPSINDYQTQRQTQQSRDRHTTSSDIRDPTFKNVCFSCYDQTDQTKHNITQWRRALHKRKKYFSELNQNLNSIDAYEPSSFFVQAGLSFNVSRTQRDSCKSISDMLRCLDGVQNYCIGDLQFHSLYVFARQWQSKLNCSLYALYGVTHQESILEATTDASTLKPFSHLIRSIPIDDDRVNQPRQVVPEEESTKRLDRLLSRDGTKSIAEGLSKFNNELLPIRIKNAPNNLMSQGIQVNGRILHPMPHSNQKPPLYNAQASSGHANYQNSMYAIQQVIVIAAALSMLTFVVAVGCTLRSARNRHLQSTNPAVGVELLTEL